MEETTLTLANGQFQLNPTSLVIAGQPDFETWEAAGKELRHMEASIHWWIGDWLNYGEQRWGEMYTQAINIFDYTKGTMANDKYIANAIEPSRRRENLSFSHHREVASLPPAEQDKLLDLAEEKKLKTREIRQIVSSIQENEPDYQAMIANIVSRIDTLAELYPPGIEQIKNYLNAM